MSKELKAPDKVTQKMTRDGAVAKDLKNSLDKDNTNFALFMNEDERAEADANGYYEILVPDFL